MERYVGKLVRDKIPEIIVAQGRTPVTRRLTDNEFLTAAKRKLIEESQEALYADSQNALIEELADIAELVDTIAAAASIPLEAISAARKEKAKKKGFLPKKSSWSQ